MFRIKKLDWLIIKSFLGPFIVTYFVVLFIFVMQTFWLYMDELLGKGFSSVLIAELLFYWSCYLTPQALPVSILLASIMTFGNLGENYELVAIKSSGISLYRFMRPLIIFMVGVSCLAFLFSNYVIPVTNLKTFSLLYDMRNQKPTLNIRSGVFNNALDGFSIRIGKKDLDGQHISDIIIYDHTNGKGNTNVIVAEKGRMYPSNDGRALVFELQNGWLYQEGRIDKSGKEGDSHPQTRMHFGKWDKVFDLSQFSFSRTKEDLFKNNEIMMNVGQLNIFIDSTKKEIKNSSNEFDRYQRPYVSLYKQDSKGKADNQLANKIEQNQHALLSYKTNFVEQIPDSIKGTILGNVEAAARSLQSFTFPVINNKEIQENRLSVLKIEWHKKFTLSFACLLLFLIGAPLGAIIRKGGLGMPTVIAIIFFVIYFIIGTTGEKLAKKHEMLPWAGVWLATIVLLPVAVIVMRQARNDSNILSKEWYVRTWNAIKGFYFSKIKKQKV